MPMLAEAGIHTFFNGPESFTPDDAYHLGLCPEMDNVWVAAGSTPSASSRRAARAWRWRSGWRTARNPSIWAMWTSPRMQPFQGNKRYLRARVTETLGLLYADHFPYRQKATARGCAARRSTSS
jgi:hypothetical protein